MQHSSQFAVASLHTFTIFNTDFDVDYLTVGPREGGQCTPTRVDARLFPRSRFLEAGRFSWQSSLEINAPISPVNSECIQCEEL